MIYNIEMQVSALLFLIVISTVFFVKVRIWTPDNKAFAKLVISAFCMVISDILCPISLASPMAPVWQKILTGKLFMIFLFFCMMYLWEYTLSLTIDKQNKYKIIKKIEAFLYRNSTILAVAMAILVVILPLTYNNENGSSYIYGPAQDLGYIMGGVFAIAIPLFAFLNRKHIAIKKQLPLYAYVFIQGSAAVLQAFNQDLLLTSTALVIVIAMLYFTLQNPDIVLLEEMNQNEKELVRQMVVALANAVDAKDHYTSGHSSRVADYSVRIAKKAGCSEEYLEKLYYMAMLHDVGKIGIPDDILNKKGKLTDSEFETIKQHPLIGGHMLGKIKAIPSLSLCARYHHERYDGKGYPEGLSGNDIPMEARIVGVADAYDAMTSTRSYRPCMEQSMVREQLVNGRGTQFDPQYLDIMLELVDNDLEYKMRETK